MVKKLLNGEYIFINGIEFQPTQAPTNCPSSAQIVRNLPGARLVASITMFISR